MGPQPLTALYELDAAISRAAVLDALRLLPDQVARAVERQDASKLLTAPRDGGWSAFQVCCHMRDAAIVYSARFRWIVFDDNPFLPNYDEDNWVASALDTVEDLPEMLGEMRALRTDLIRVLQRLPESSWGRTGRHEVIGDVLLDSYVRHQLAHERLHLAQLQAALDR